MPFCPKCKFEYKQGAETCPDCGAALVEALPAEQGLESPDEGERKWKLLYIATSRPAAEFLNETLRNEGIASVVKYRGRFFGRGVAHGLGAVTGAGDAEIWVDEKQFEEAEGIRRQTVGDDDTSHGYIPTDNDPDR